MLDNLSAHKTQAVDQFLAQNLKVRLHFTPTYSFWLNQVEIWIAKIERDVIRPWGIYFLGRPSPQTNEVYPRLRPPCSSYPLEVY